MSEQRFTAWLSVEERTKLRALASEHGCSENFIVRMALRSLLFGHKVPSYMQTGGVRNEAASTRR